MKIGAKLRSMGEHAVGFFCPGCAEFHLINIHPNSRPRWTYNENPDAPTFKPSVLVRTGHYVPGHSGECWCTWADEDGEKSKFNCSVCHSFVTDGKIQFLSDSTHALAGQTVELPNVRE